MHKNNPICFVTVKKKTKWKNWNNLSLRIFTGKELYHHTPIIIVCCLKSCTRFNSIDICDCFSLFKKEFHAFTHVHLQFYYILLCKPLELLSDGAEFIFKTSPKFSIVLRFWALSWPFHSIPRVILEWFWTKMIRSALCLCPRHPHSGVLISQWFKIQLM